ncbi:hypothetical protein GCM10020258_51930 [Sphingomonas yabuuchiae]
MIGSIYHAFLREGLEKLGYQIELRGKHGTFEIAGVPKAILEAFSQRREEIVAKAGALGISSPQGMREVTTRTRDPKLNVEDRDDLRAGWIDKAARLGFDGKALLEAAVARAQRARPAARSSAATGPSATRSAARGRRCRRWCNLAIRWSIAGWRGSPSHPPWREPSWQWHRRCGFWRNAKPLSTCGSSPRRRSIWASRA